MCWSSTRRERFPPSREQSRVKAAAGAPLRILRTLLHADHALVFVRLASGDVSLVASDPPQLPSQPFELDDRSLWPREHAPLLLSDAEQIQRSPLGWMLAGARGTMLAVSSTIVVAPEGLPAGTAEISTFLLWQEPNVPPAHVHANLPTVAQVIREHLSSMQQFAEYTRASTRLHVLLDALPHGIVLTDEVSGTAVVNVAAAHLLGVTPGVLDAPGLASAMEQLHERMSNAGEVKLDGQTLFARGGGARINWVWEVVHPERRTLLVSTLPVRSTGHEGRLWSFHDVTALRAAEAEQARLLRQLERERSRVNEMLASAPAMILLLRGPDHVIEFANDAIRRAAGGEELVGQRLFDDHLPALRGSDFHAMHDAVYRTGEAKTSTALQITSEQLGGRPEVFANVSLQPVRDAEGVVTGIFAHSVDVTAQVSALEQLRQSQKLEAIGRLTGGVAHDFNNLLTVIGGNTEFLLAELTPASQAHNDATEVREAVRRASDLTRQLLSFSRRQVLQRHVVEIDHVVHGVEKLLRRVIGEHIALETILGAANATVMVDPGQLEQVLVNLAVNARDAMSEGGRLTIRTSMQVTPPPGAAASAGIRGAHVRILMRDSGHGMDAATLARATEPFFTTKPAGKGTGLGLATVKDIVAQSDGHLWIESAPGAGTSVWIALPLAAASATTHEEPATAPGRRCAGSILLVEDESGVRHITQRILEDAGYQVQVAIDGHEGLRRWRECTVDRRTPIDCVVTDVVMPSLGGRAMVREMRAIDGNLPVLFMSGYVEGGLTEDELAGRTAFLSKPFTADELLIELAALIDRD
jgi:signal transduction histidine kinase/ActR/RegA family two-component response regulator